MKNNDIDPTFMLNTDKLIFPKNGLNSSNKNDIEETKEENTLESIKMPQNHYDEEMNYSSTISNSNINQPSIFDDGDDFDDSNILELLNQIENGVKVNKKDNNSSSNIESALTAETFDQVINETLNQTKSSFDQIQSILNEMDENRNQTLKMVSTILSKAQKERDEAIQVYENIKSKYFNFKDGIKSKPN
ncbi:hypothetical protein K502DRAFT_220730 [Neoconidiobolus thromboides FSU 785]|nr:hypothetical protein K502DRAFT_220730 [Neoconidiobolus thromboides FSU 785]